MPGIKRVRPPLKHTPKQVYSKVADGRHYNFDYKGLTWLVTGAIRHSDDHLLGNQPLVMMLGDHNLIHGWEYPNPSKLVPGETLTYTAIDDTVYISVQNDFYT